MSRCFLSFLVLLLSWPGFSNDIMCEGSLTSKSEVQTESLEFNDFVTKIEQQIADYIDSSAGDSFRVETLPIYKEKGELVKILNAIAKNSLKHEFTFRNLLWLPVEAEIFSNAEALNPKYVRRIEDVFSVLMKDSATAGFVLHSEVKNLKVHRKALATKRYISMRLQRLSYFYSLYYGREVNLEDPEQLLAHFGVEKISQLDQAISDLVRKNRSLHQKIKDMLVGVAPNLSPARQLTREIFRKHFGGIDVRGTGEVINFFERRMSANYAIELISKLYPIGNNAQEYKKKIKTIAAEKDLEIDESLKKSAYMLLVFEAYFKVIGEVPGFTSYKKAARRFRIKSILHVIRGISSYENANIISEERFFEYVEKSDQLTARIEDLYARFEEHGLSAKGLKPVEIDEAFSLLAPAEKEKGADVDLEAVELKVIAAEVGLDALLEESLVSVKPVEITTFSQLNYRRSRLFSIRDC